MPERYVLCASRAACDALVPGEWAEDAGSRLLSILATDRTAWLPKAETEGSPEWLQVIPVLVLRDRFGRVLSYRRRVDAGEARLADLTSLCIGGHCERDIDRFAPFVGPHTALIHCLQREISEEVERPKGLTLDALHARPVGLIRSDRTPVDRAHLGWCWVGTLERPGDLVAGEEIAGWAWSAPAGLREAADSGMVRLESWADIVLRHALGA